jgi:RNA polymerase sigma-70 factor (ECF subfamily)
MDAQISARSVRLPPARWRMTAASEREEQLVARARAGEREAFEELVREHADRLHAVVLRVCGDVHEAEEVTQETFLRAWRSLERFEGRSQFFTWLYRIGVNEIKRRLERGGRGPRTASLDPAIELADERAGPAERAEALDLQRALERAILELPMKYRMPLVLRDVEGLSTADAAAIMELGEAAFKSRLHRARLAVREAVEPVMEDEA